MVKGGLETARSLTIVTLKGNTMHNPAAETSNYIVVIFRIIGGDACEVPTVGYSSYKWAVRAVLSHFGLRLSDVILCRE